MDNDEDKKMKGRFVNLTYNGKEICSAGSWSVVCSNFKKEELLYPKSEIDEAIKQHKIKAGVISINQK